MMISIDMKQLCGVLMAFILTGSTAMAQDMTLKTDADKKSYAFGMVFGGQIATSLERVEEKLDTEILMRALSDMINKKDTLLSQEELEAFLKGEQEKQIAASEVEAAKLKQSGEAFLAEYGQQEGVMKTESGIFYKVLTAGEGEKPSVSDTVKVHYKGTLKDGTEFDSSYARGEPIEFPVGGVIKGWQEILPMMPTGSKWEVAIPSDLAYGENGAGDSIGPNEPLVFVIELLEVK